MKKLLFMLMISTIGFSQERFDDKFTIEQKERFTKAKAIASEVDGIFVFISSKPIERYKVIGQVIMNAFDSRKYSEQIYVLINKTKKKHPDAHGIIIITTSDRFEAEVIKFDEL